MKFEIKNRFTGAVLYSGEGESFSAAVRQAISARANLADANLADADLAGANLAGAYLADADLADANLAGANLAGANLAGADLAGADLADADLAGADLAGANLADADLAGANLAGAYLAGAYLADADLADANLAGANLADARNIPEIPEVADPAVPWKRAITDEEREQRRLDRMVLFRARNPDVPVIERLDAKILAVVEGGTGKLEMGGWHTCETTHCRAGWAIHLAGEKGYALERQYGAHHAGRMLYLAATGRVPHFFATNERAMEDIKAWAAKESA